MTALYDFPVVHRPRTEDGWTTAEAAALAGTTHRCLGHWATRGVFGERLAHGPGSGTPRRFRAEDIAAARAVERAARRLRHDNPGAGLGSMSLFRRVAEAVYAGADQVPVTCTGVPSMVVTIDPDEGTALLIRAEGLRDGLD